MATIASAERLPGAFRILSRKDYPFGNGLASRAVGVRAVLPVTPPFKCIRHTGNQINAEPHEASNAPFHGPPNISGFAMEESP
jgi:hypothetical protein